VACIGRRFPLPLQAETRSRLRTVARAPGAFWLVAWTLPSWTNASRFCACLQWLGGPSGREKFPSRQIRVGGNWSDQWVVCLTF
jgi:hypothetical protein